jgi:hypothetical protein
VKAILLFCLHSLAIVFFVANFPATAQTPPAKDCELKTTKRRRGGASKAEKHLLKAFEAGLDEEASAGAYFGISMESFEKLWKTGRLQGAGLTPAPGGKLNLIPRTAALTEGTRDLVEGARSDVEALRAAKLEAENAARIAVRRRVNPVAARSYKGILLLLSPKVYSDFSITKAEERGEISISVGEGLPHSYIVGVEPLGQREWDFLSELQKR